VCATVIGSVEGSKDAMRRFEMCMRRDRGIEILHTVTTAILVRSLLNAQVCSIRRCVQLRGEHETVILQPTESYHIHQSAVQCSRMDGSRTDTKNHSSLSLSLSLTSWSVKSFPPTMLNTIPLAYEMHY
jgi:hypothetical protein